MMLISAKWRDYRDSNPECTESDVNEEPDYTPKPSRSRAAKVTFLIRIVKMIIEWFLYEFWQFKVPVQEEIPDEDDEEYEDKVKKKRSSRSKKGSNKKNSSAASKVPTLKIKLGKRRRGSSVSN